MTIKIKKIPIIAKLTVYDIALRPLLRALEWKGSNRQLQEAIPYFSQINSIYMLNDVMHNLNFEVNSFSVQLRRIDSRLLPCVFISESNEVLVLLSRDEDRFKVFDPKTKKNRELQLPKPKEKSIDDKNFGGYIYCFKPAEKDDRTQAQKASWMRKTYLSSRSLVYSSILLSFMLNLLALGTPLFIMFVYNRVITAISISMLWQFSMGILIALLGISILSMLRAEQLAIIGARFDRSMGNNIFERLLYLSPTYTESATVGSQVARLKDFSRLREFMTGSLMTAFFEMPFIVISLVIIALLGGALVLVPVIMVILYALLGFFLYNESQRRISAASFHAARLQEFNIETVSHIRALKYTGAITTWLNRYRELSASSSYAGLRNAMLLAINRSTSDALMIASGMSVLGFGAIKIMNGTLNVGAMLAVMILTWRILAPLKTFFNIYPRVLQMVDSLTQISRLMQIKPEIKPTTVVKNRVPVLHGRLTLHQVSFRYNEAYQPTLMNVSFDIKPGVWAGIVGRNGSGKSTVLKLILSLYQQQAGSVRIDDQDIRQLNAIELRSMISYMPQEIGLFYGTIATNLRLADPTATEEDMKRAAKEIGLLDTIMALPEGFNSHIRDYSSSQLSRSFQQRLCLVRALLKKSSILLLDEPSGNLDRNADEQFIEALQRLHGKMTIIMVTHRPSHLKLMDYLVVLDKGVLVLQGPPDKVLEQLPVDLI